MKFLLLLSCLKIEQILRAIRDKDSNIRLKVRLQHDESANTEDIIMSVFGLLTHGEFHFLLGKGEVLGPYASHWIVVVGTFEEPVEVSQKAFAFPMNPGQSLSQVFHIIDNAIRKVVE